MYFRVVRRGFYSCRHPPELAGRLSFDDLDLLAWYPSLNSRDEKQIHRACSASWGEFHPVADVATAMQWCRELGGVCVMPDKHDLELAKKWARRAPLHQRNA